MRPGSKIKTKRFEFTPETAVRNVLVTQVGRKTVPNMLPGNSEAPVAECVVCAWNGTRSVGSTVRSSPAANILDILVLMYKIFVKQRKNFEKLHKKYMKRMRRHVNGLLNGSFIIQIIHYQDLSRYP